MLFSASYTYVMVALRLLGMICCLLVVFALFHGTIGKKISLSEDHGQGMSVFESVYLHCLLLVVTLGYYCLGKLCRSIFHAKRGGVRDAVTTHIEMTRDFAADRSGRLALMTVPRLTIWNVWILVYGLGFVFFVTGYSFLGLHSLCAGFLGPCLGILCVDEVICPRVARQDCYLVGRGAVASVAIVAHVLVSAQYVGETLPEYISKVDLYSLIFGTGLPLMSQLLLVVIRDSRRYTLGSVLEVCEFGFPFTAFLAVFHLCVAYGQRYQSDTDALSAFNSMSTANTSAFIFDFNYWYHFNDTQIMVDQLWAGFDAWGGLSAVFYVLAPLFAIPALVCYVGCVLEGSAVDSLLALVCALSVKNLCYHGPAPAVVAGFVLCCFGLVGRVLCEYRPRLMERSTFYDMQSESSQLTHQVVWSRDDCKLAQELTCDLQDGECP